MSGPWERYRKPERKADPSYQGSVLPFSVGPDGKARFDSDAGIVGTIKRAVTLPREVMEGKVDPRTDEGLGRVLEASGAAVPGNPASRAIRGTMRKAKVDTPTAEELKAAAGSQYDEVRGMGVDYKSSSIKSLADDAQAGLEKDGIIDETAPLTYKVLRKLQSPPAGSVAPITHVVAARKAFRDIAHDHAGTRDGEAARRVAESLGRFVEDGSPQTVVAGPAATAGNLQRRADGNYAASKRSARLHGVEKAADLRAAAANSGHNEGNAIRQRLASMLLTGDKGRGFTPEEIAQVETVIRGTRGQNTARNLAAFLGGGGGLAQAGMAAGGATIGAFTGAGPGAAVGAALPIIAGAGARGIHNRLTQRGLSKVDEATRQRSPLYQERLQAAPMVPVPSRTREDLAQRLLLLQQLEEQQ